MSGGVDEAGRGPVLGPLVVAGVVCEDSSVLAGLGVKDSKELKPQRREELFSKITEIARHCIIEISAPELNELMKRKDLNEIEVDCFAKVISGLPKTDVVYVDAADVIEERFAANITKRLDKPINIVAKHKADTLYPEVSAASILAKVHRDQRLKEISLEAGENVGSGYPADPVTIKFLENWISHKGNLPPFARAMWETSKRLLANSRQRQLDDFGKK